MDTLLVLLGLASLIAMIVGLINPGLVIRWGEKKTRPRVLMVYGGLLIVLLIEMNNKNLIYLFCCYIFWYLIDLNYIKFLKIKYP